MATCISRSPEETSALGERWGRVARPGWVLGLSGELGAGKTQLVKGLALGLGVPGRVLSPTVALVNSYAGGRLPLVHLDLYRLETAAEIAAAGLEEFLRDGSGVTVIEWAERWFPAASHEPSWSVSTLPGVGALEHAKAWTPNGVAKRTVPMRDSEIVKASHEPRSLGVQPLIAPATKGCISDSGDPRRADEIAQAFRHSTRLELPARWRSVRIETLSETERRIVYEDLGA